MQNILLVFLEEYEAAIVTYFQLSLTFSKLKVSHNYKETILFQIQNWRFILLNEALDSYWLLRSSKAVNFIDFIMVSSCRLHLV